jgi:hypothetical protein
MIAESVWVSHWLRSVTFYNKTTTIDGAVRAVAHLKCIHMNLPAGAFFSRFWGSLPSLPSTFKIFRPWKKSSTIKSWPTFCDQYFWKFPICSSRADEKHREIQMVKVNVIFNDIRLLICLTPLQVNWVMVIN